MKFYSIDIVNITLKHIKSAVLSVIFNVGQDT